MNTPVIFAALASCLAFTAFAADAFRTEKNIRYYGADKIAAGSEAMKKKCFLDVRVPVKGTNFPTVVWFHGGGLKSGRRGEYCQICNRPEN